MSARLSRWWASWVALLDRKERGDTLALFRVAVGLVVVFTLLGILRADVADIIWVDANHGGYRGLGRGPFLVRWLGGPTPGVVWGIVTTSLVSSLLLTVGLGGRVTAFVALQTYLALHRMNGEASGSSDIVITNALWVLVLARSTATLSVDCWLRGRRFTSDDEIPAWPRYLILLQIVLLYSTTGLQKVSIYWLPFGGYSALFYILQQPSWARFDLTGLLGWIYPLTQVGTAVTWLWEVCSPVLFLIFWYRATPERGGRLRRWFNRFDLRVPWMVIGLAMHATIALTMVVGPFSAITVSLYLSLWHPDELRRLFAWLRRRFSSGAAPAAVAQ